MQIIFCTKRNLVYNHMCVIVTVLASSITAVTSIMQPSINVPADRKHVSTISEMGIPLNRYITGPEAHIFLATGSDGSRSAWAYYIDRSCVWGPPWWWIESGEGRVPTIMMIDSLGEPVALMAICVLYHKTSNIRRTFAVNKIVDHSDVVGASLVGAAPATSSFST